MQSAAIYTPGLQATIRQSQPQHAHLPPHSVRFAHLRLHSLPSMRGDCPCVVFARPNARMHPRTTLFRVTTAFCPQRTRSSALYLLCPSLSVARQPHLPWTNFGFKMTENHFYGLKSTPSLTKLINTSVPRCVATAGGKVEVPRR